VEFPVSGKKIYSPAPYDSFSDLVRYLNDEAYPRKKSSVITFNYDIAVDYALFQNGLGPDYGLGQTVKGNPVVPLLKLHGSLNWGSESGKGGIRPLLLSDYFSKYSLSPFPEIRNVRVPIGSQLKDYFDRFTDVEIEKEPFVVPPSWNKADHHKSLSSVWQRAAQELSEAQYIFVIGYSMPETDAFFRLLYALGTAEGGFLNGIEVFNPDDTGVVKGRFSGMLGPGAESRFQYHEETFESAIKRIKSYFPSR
jgi:hypothetical protein